VKKLRLALLGVVATLLMTAAPASAITYGEPDAGEHPYVGFMIFFDPTEPGWFSCSGTLLSPTVFLTAGHCTNLGASWSASPGGAQIGTRAGTSFPVNDYGIVRYTSTISNPGSVNLYNGSSRDITGSGNVFNGQSLCRSGSTTGLRCGSVTGTSVTVNYAQGPVYDTIRTNICAEGGDSGGSLFGGSIAYGLTSGGSGNCSSGGTTFFQKVPEALSVYGVSVY